MSMQEIARAKANEFNITKAIDGLRVGISYLELWRLLDDFKQRLKHVHTTNFEDEKDPNPPHGVIKYGISSFYSELKGLLGKRPYERIEHSGKGRWDERLPDALRGITDLRAESDTFEEVRNRLAAMLERFDDSYISDRVRGECEVLLGIDQKGSDSIDDQLAFFLMEGIQFFSSDQDVVAQAKELQGGGHPRLYIKEAKFELDKALKALS